MQPSALYRHHRCRESCCDQYGTPEDRVCRKRKKSRVSLRGMTTPPSDAASGRTLLYYPFAHYIIESERDRVHCSYLFRLHGRIFQQTIQVVRTGTGVVDAGKRENIMIIEEKLNGKGSCYQFSRKTIVNITINTETMIKKASIL